MKDSVGDRRRDADHAEFAHALDIEGIDDFIVLLNNIVGEGVFYDEPKSETAKLALTPTGKARLKQLAALNKLSMSEYVERWLSGKTEGLKLP